MIFNYGFRVGSTKTTYEIFKIKLSVILYNKTHAVPFVLLKRLTLFSGIHSITYTGLTKSAISTQHLAILSIVDVVLIVDTTNL